MDLAYVQSLSSLDVVEDVMNPGDKRGRWTMIRDADPPKYASRKKHYGLLRCACGTERVIDIESVVRGYSRSCGCAKREWQRAAIRSEVAAAAAKRKGK